MSIDKPPSDCQSRSPIPLRSKKKRTTKRKNGDPASRRRRGPLSSPIFLYHRPSRDALEDRVNEPYFF